MLTFTIVSGLFISWSFFPPPSDCFLPFPGLLLALARSRVVSCDSGLLLCSNNRSWLYTHHVKENYPTHWQVRNLKQGPKNQARENVRMLFSLTKSKLTFTKQNSGLLAPPSHYSVCGLQADWGRCTAGLWLKENPRWRNILELRIVDKTQGLLSVCLSEASCCRILWLYFTNWNHFQHHAGNHILRHPYG